MKEANNRSVNTMAGHQQTGVELFEICKGLIDYLAVFFDMKTADDRNYLFDAGYPPGVFDYVADA